MIYLLYFLLFSNLHAIEERDWVNDWPYRPIPGLEQVPAISIDEIEGYEFSVTYALDGGRFGDQLTNYLRALWISWKFDLPFYYRDFDYSDKLCLSDAHPALQEFRDTFAAKLEYFHYLELDKSNKVFSYLKSPGKGKKLIWNIGMLTPFIEEHFCEKLDDEQFRAFIQPLVRPREDLSLVQLPEDRKSIALHVRTGVGYDLKVNIVNMPTKFPPDSFYLAALKEVISFFNNEPLYIHLFTDHPDPRSIRDRFYNIIAGWRLENDFIFECRVENRHDQNVLEDLFSMARFDAIIHPDSSLSRLAVTLSAPIVEAKPTHWSEFRRDSSGHALYDNMGNVIVDPLIIFRSQRGKDTTRRNVYPINEDFLNGIYI